MSSSYSELHDPQGLLGAQLPLDREPHMALVKAVLAWTDAAKVPNGDCEQIALQLTGHSRAVLEDLRARCKGLPETARVRALTEEVIEETDRQLSAPWLGTVHCVKQRARIVRALYERLDRLGRIDSARPAAPSA
ncbi:DUF6415 family natural product biosynthesis protein [Streptomyces antimycoticus]|uniref:DUF6415 family natural product biosynthesis protein n=1 Tax=Streptomyces antimycoticus TaxID=68175 RepID=UPI000A370BB9|nr:DUF6415 family natural product biosynthesis protein [Streptomyces antimycoticus]